MNRMGHSFQGDRSWTASRYGCRSQHVSGPQHNSSEIGR